MRRTIPKRSLWASRVVALTVSAGLMVFAALSATLPGHAATPAQAAAVAERARSDAAKAHAAALAKAASDAAAQAHRTAVTQSQALVKIKANILAETKARTEAARKAAEVNAGIVDAAHGGAAAHLDAPAFKPELHRLGDRHWFNNKRTPGKAPEPGEHARIASQHH